MNNDRAEQIWKHRFVSHFVGKLRLSGYTDADEGLLDVAYQHANASWPERDEDDTPEDSARGEFEALADSI